MYSLSMRAILRGLRGSILRGLLLFLLTPLSTLGSTAVPAASTLERFWTEPEARVGELTSYRLPNGFRVVLVPYPNASDVRIELMVKAGSKMEVYGQTGLAHVLEHMSFLKAGARENVGAELAELVSYSNAITDSDSTRYLVSMVPKSQRVEEVLRIKADQFFRPVFDEQEVRREVQVVLNELDNSADDVVQLMVAALDRNSFALHGYSRTVVGARSDVANITADALRTFHGKHYRPDNAALIVSGRFDHQEILDLSLELFGQAAIPPGSAPVNRTQEEKLRTHQISKMSRPIGVTRVASAWKLPGYAHRQTHVANVALQAVCSQGWGSLKRDLVERRKLAFSASCFVITRPDYSLVMAFASAGTLVRPQMLSDELSRHFEKAALLGVHPAQLQRGKIGLRNNFEQQTQNHTEMAELLATGEAAGDWRLPFWVRDVEQSVTPTEANEVLRRWLISENRADVLVEHTDVQRDITLPYKTEVASIVNSKSWPAVVLHGDPPPQSLNELANSTVLLDLDPHGSRAAFISRSTQNDKVWLEFRNDYGNSKALKGRTDACNIADEVMRSGGTPISQNEIQVRLANLNVQYHIGLSGFGIEVPRQNLQEAFAILMDSWNAPKLRREVYNSVKEEFIGGLQSHLNKPLSQLRSALEMRFDNFPKGHPDKPEKLQDKIRRVQRISYAEVQRCVSDFARLSNARLAVVGAITEQEVRDLWAATSQMQRGSIPYRRIEKPSAPLTVDASPITLQHQLASSAVVKASAVIKISQRSPEFPALELAVFSLNESDKGRLWKKMRDELGLSYETNVYLNVDEFDERATIEFHATVSNELVDAAEQALRSLVAELLRYGLTDEEISQAKKAWAEKRAANLDAESGYAESLVDGLLTGKAYQRLASLDKEIEDVNPEKIAQALGLIHSGQIIFSKVERASQH